MRFHIYRSIGENNGMFYFFELVKLVELELELNWELELAGLYIMMIAKDFTRR